MMCGEGGSFAASGEWEFSKQRIGCATGDFGKGISVEEKERRTSVASAEKVEQLLKTYFRLAERFPFEPDSLMSF